MKTEKSAAAKRRRPTKAKMKAVKNRVVEALPQESEASASQEQLEAVAFVPVSDCEVHSIVKRRVYAEPSITTAVFGARMDRNGPVANAPKRLLKEECYCSLCGVMFDCAAAENAERRKQEVPW